MSTDLVTPHEVDEVGANVDEGGPLGCQAVAQRVLAFRRMQELHHRRGKGRGEGLVMEQWAPPGTSSTIKPFQDEAGWQGTK